MSQDKKVDAFLDNPIGTQDHKALTPKPVEVKDIILQEQKKDGVVLGSKAILICKHPDKEELIHISQVAYIRDKKLTTHGLWYKLDNAGQIVKQSALSALMHFYGASMLRALINRTLSTETDEKGYLVLKAY